MSNSKTPGKSGPGRAAYLLGCLPILAGFGVMIALLVVNLPKMSDDLHQIVVPGARELTLEAGEHMVFLETRSMVDGRSYVADDVSGLAVSVVNADGLPIAVSPPSGTATYSLGGREGYAIAVFEVVTAGRHTVSEAYEDGVAAPETVIAVSGDFMGGLMGTAFSGLTAAFVGLLGAVAVVLWVRSRRRKVARTS